MALLDLPEDIILLVVALLTAKDFVNFTSTCRALAPYKADPAYWRPLVQSTFRVPNQPLLNTYGSRWKELYQRLATESTVYTWGNGQSGNLGHDRGLARGRSRFHTSEAWPSKVGLEIKHPVVDVQCG